MNAQTCYMCEGKARSREHAPPESFFPTDHRKQLLKVPSCDMHNAATAKDDEYVRNILVTFAGCNELASGFLTETVKRSFKHSPKLLKRTFHNFVWTEFEGKKTVAFEMDLERVKRTMHKIACALHYSHFREKVSWETCTLIKQLVGPDLKGGDADKPFAMLDSQSLQWHGSNPLVFKYRFIRYEGVPSTFHFVFYEGVDVIVAPFLGDLTQPATRPESK